MRDEPERGTHLGVTTDGLASAGAALAAGHVPPTRGTAWLLVGYGPHRVERHGLWAQGQQTMVAAGLRQALLQPDQDGAHRVG